MGYRDRIVSRYVLLCVLAAWPHLGSAQTTEPSTSDDGRSNPVARLDSKPRSVLGGLNDHGLSFQVLGIYDWSETVERDKDPSEGFGRVSVDLFMPVDGHKLAGIKGCSGLVRLKYHKRNFGESDDSVAQLYSNIDARSQTTLYEMWVEQKLFSDKVRLKAGKIDSNTEFAAVPSAADFLNSSMGYSPTIMEFPSYPEPKLAFNAFLRPFGNYGVGFGMFRTSSSATLFIFEPNRSWTVGESERPGHLNLGYWRLDGTVERFDGGQDSGAQGFYAVVEQSLWRQALPEGEGGRQATAFAQFGRAAGDVSPFTHHVGAGGVIEGPFGKRKQDAIGAAATWVHFTSEPDAGFDLSSELAVEAYYKAVFTRHVSLVQDFQYLRQPGGTRAHQDFFVFTPRVVVSF